MICVFDAVSDQEYNKNDAIAGNVSEFRTRKKGEPCLIARISDSFCLVHFINAIYCLTLITFHFIRTKSRMSRSNCKK